MSKKWIFSAVAAAGLAVALAAPAAAHVTAQPGEATQGGYTAFAFRVPNERPEAGTVKLEVSLPAEHPISVRTKPMADWTAEVVKDGDAVRTVTWTAKPGVRINPGEYQEFEVSAGPLPENTDMLVMPATQSYDSGEVVAWDAPPVADGAQEPEHPAPVLRLLPEAAGESGAGTAAAPTVTGTSASAVATATDSTARWLGGAGLFLGALGLGLGAGAVLRIRRGGAA
ncbi:MAG: YcnI family protein [Pseudonocardiaceae bacterium]